IRARPRTGGRVLLLDREDRLLLIEERRDRDSSQTHWLTPGGGLEPGESALQAAQRELYEETGLRLSLGDGPPVHVARRQWSLAGQWWDQTDHYFLLRVEQSSPAVQAAALTESEQSLVLGSRWWTQAELMKTTELVFPQDLLWLLDRLLGRQPAQARTAGRVLLVDPTRRVLLLEHRTETGSVWAAPGGGCESGERPAEAARRELAEECGIRLALDPAATADHIESRRWNAGGVAYDQTDHFFLVEVPSRPAVSALDRTEAEGLTMLGHRWCSVADLRALRESGQRYEPDALPLLLEGSPAAGTPVGRAGER
ncbi:MAG: mismatch repair protein MutT, partial [Frankiales bacterium]|nr:mismatch repair protein MutT [Frankiales bacterium]